MISFYTKLISGGASLIVQVLLVVGAVLAFMFIDPFGIVSPQKRMLNDTPAQVESIKQLGELITAEYYGEVVSSLGETVAEIEQADVDSFNSYTTDLHADFFLAIESFREIPKIRRGKYQSTFESEFGDLASNPLYEKYLKFIWVNIRSLSKKYTRQKFEGGKLSKFQKNALFKELYKKEQSAKELKDLETDVFTTVYEEKISKDNKKKYKRAKLAMLGRGWVKAGIDFEDFNEHNFVYNKDYQSIHFIGFEPKIISATINPWFIPEKGIEGFEFLVANRKVKMRPDFVLDVKRQCLNKLTDQALRKGIKQKAQDNAANFLKGFFALLLDQDIKQVCFHENHLNSVKEFILMDGVISNEEIFWIDSALIQHQKANGNKNGWEEAARTFIDSLMAHHNYEINGVSVGLNSRSHILFKVFEDRLVDSLDVVNMNKQLKNNSSELLWNVNLGTSETEGSVEFERDFAKLLTEGDTTNLTVALDSTMIISSNWARESLTSSFLTR